jgi:hypothetical protein
MSKITQAVDAVRAVLEQQHKDLSPYEYVLVLEELGADIDAALKQEGGK